MLRSRAMNSRPQPDHGGGNIFLSTADPDYQKILRWITDGALND